MAFTKSELIAALQDEEPGSMNLWSGMDAPEKG